MALVFNCIAIRLIGSALMKATGPSSITVRVYTDEARVPVSEGLARLPSFSVCEGKARLMRMQRRETALNGTTKLEKIGELLWENGVLLLKYRIHRQCD